MAEATLSSNVIRLDHQRIARGLPMMAASMRELRHTTAAVPAWFTWMIADQVDRGLIDAECATGVADLWAWRQTHPPFKGEGDWIFLTLKEHLENLRSRRGPDPQLEERHALIQAMLAAVAPDHKAYWAHEEMAVRIFTGFKGPLGAWSDAPVTRCSTRSEAIKRLRKMQSRLKRDVASLEAGTEPKFSIDEGDDIATRIARLRGKIDACDRILIEDEWLRVERRRRGQPKAGVARHG